MAKKLSEDEIRDAVEKEQSASIGELSVGPEYWHGLAEGAEQAIPLARQGYVEPQEAGAALDVLRAIGKLSDKLMPYSKGLYVNGDGSWWFGDTTGLSTKGPDGKFLEGDDLSSLLEALRPHLDEGT